MMFFCIPCCLEKIQKNCTYIQKICNYKFKVYKIFVYIHKKIECTYKNLYPIFDKMSSKIFNIQHLLLAFNTHKQKLQVITKNESTPNSLSNLYIRDITN